MSAGRPAPSSTVVVPGRVVALHGCLGVHAAADVRLVLADAVGAGDGDLVVDLSGVSALDATGLGVLVGVHRRAGRVGRSLVLQDVSVPVARVLFLTRLDKVLRMQQTAHLA